MTDAQSTTMMSGRYQRALTIAVVVLVAGSHLAGGGGQLLQYRPDYASFAFQAVIWLVMAVAIGIGSVLMLRGSLDWRLAGRDRRAGRLHRLGRGKPGRPDAGGQLGVGERRLDRRARAAPHRLAELAWFLAVEATAIFSVQAWDGLDRLDLAAFLALLAWSTGAQIAVAAAVKALDAAADRAAAAARSEDAARERAATAEIIQAARQARWLALQESTAPLVAELAAGADPGDEQLRVRWRSRRPGSVG